METKIASFTFFAFLFFTVSAARLAVDPAAVHGEDEASSSKTSHQSAATGSNILLPGQRPNNSDLDENNNNHHLPSESEKTTNDLTPQANFSRFHPINRHFHGKVPPRVQKPRRPCKHPMPPQHRNPRIIERSGETDGDVVSERMINLHPKASRGDFQSNWLLKAKHHHHHHYGPRRYHGGNDVEEEGDVMMMNRKQVVDREKVRSSIVRQQKQKQKKKREEEAGFMKSIRKFLKHTFD